jgi:hypothetical protein
VLLLGTAVLLSGGSAVAQPAASPRILIDAAKVEGEISPTLYGQFDEFMFEGVKGGLSAELVRDRSFSPRILIPTTRSATEFTREGFRSGRE